MSTNTLKLGEERHEPNEERDTAIIIDTIIKRLTRDYPPGQTLRQFHAKMHGLVHAEFTVNPHLPPHLQTGCFVPGKTYKALIRFSNGSTTVDDDRKADLRGMAIKLLDVPGEMILQDHQRPQSQDFLLVSYPTLMSPKVADFKRNIQAICKGIPGIALFAINPANWPTLVRTLKSFTKCSSVFALQYYSVSPSRLKQTAVKYAAAPATIAQAPQGAQKSKNFLREQMQLQLHTTGARFNFMVQLQEDPLQQPIENVCVRWNTQWLQVATIEIPPQHFNSLEIDVMGANTTFSPWHSLVAHQPLGGISRARKAAYEAISKFRIERNRKAGNTN